MTLSEWRDFNHYLTDQWHSGVSSFWKQQKPTLPWFNDFGFGLFPHEVSTEVPRELRDIERRFRELNRIMRCEKNEPASTVGKDGFQVFVDVHQFTPKEITIKTHDGSVIIEAMHEERQDEHGYISRELRRRYILPHGYDANTLTSELSTDGILTIKAPLPNSEESKERVINIQSTGIPAHLSVKENKPIENEKEEKKAPDAPQYINGLE
jgi:HSP20 family molecular chaperone IbpA